MKSADHTKLKGIISREADWHIKREELDNEDLSPRHDIKCNQKKCKVMQDLCSSTTFCYKLEAHHLKTTSEKDRESLADHRLTVSW